MSGYVLLFVLCLLALIAIGVMLYPFRKNRFFLTFAAPIGLILLGLAYWHWGSWSNWQRHIQQTIQQKHVRAVLQSVQGPQEIIDKLNRHLKDKPNSARGWFLLGRLYASQNQWESARAAFVKAHDLKPNDDVITINYAQSLITLNHQQFSQESRNLLQAVLQHNPNQPDALALLAMDAYMSHDYQQAISLWQHLLTIAPAGSEEAQAIRKAIAKAQAEDNK